MQQHRAVITAHQFPGTIPLRGVQSAEWGVVPKHLQVCARIGKGRRPPEGQHDGVLAPGHQALGVVTTLPVQLVGVHVVQLVPYLQSQCGALSLQAAPQDCQAEKTTQLRACTASRSHWCSSRGNLTCTIVWQVKEGHAVGICSSTSGWSPCLQVAANCVRGCEVLQCCVPYDCHRCCSSCTAGSVGATPSLCTCTGPPALHKMDSCTMQDPQAWPACEVLFGARDC